MADVLSAPAPTIADNLRRVRDRIADAAIRARRRPEDVTLVAVTRPSRSRRCVAALAAGQTVFGENRVQEAATKFPALRCRTPFQSAHHRWAADQQGARRGAAGGRDRDAGPAAPGRCDRSGRWRRKAARRTLLIEVNTGDEPQKSGVARADADAFIDECKARFGAALVGLMCVPPLDQDPRPHFEWLAERAARHGLGVLSMGMSADFEIAIACGATWVRVGSAIFGHR